MAIFRAETKSISRGKGHNLVAALSYRAGIALTDTNELNPKATTHDYTKKTDVVHTEILLPKDLHKELQQNGITLDFQSIADLVEKGETTKRGKMKNSARLGREWVLCGVPELSRAENIQLFQQFAKEQGEEQGVISMCFVHDPKAGNDMRSKSGAADATAKDERNIHAHIVLLTRKVQLTKTNTLKLCAKSYSEMSNDERTNGKVCAETGRTLVKGKGLVSNSQWIKDVRKSWAEMLNEKLLEKGVQPVTHKSYRELGLDIIPTSHVGNNELSKHKRLNNERINKRNESVIKSAADSIIAAPINRFRAPVAGYQTSTDKIRAQIAKSAADDRHRENEQRARERSQGIAYTNEVCDRVAEFNTRQARKLNAENGGTREQIASSATNKCIRESERRIAKQDRAIALSVLVYDRVAEFDPRPTRATENRIGKVYTREQLVARSTSYQSFYRKTAVSAIKCYESNLRIIASRLAWRKVHHVKYDDRQMKELDAFYKTLDVRDFTMKSVSRDDYVSPQDWTDIVRSKLMDIHIINNSEIIAIVRDPKAERESYLSKTSQNALYSVGTTKTHNGSLESSKLSQGAIETSSRHTNRFKP